MQFHQYGLSSWVCSKSLYQDISLNYFHKVVFHLIYYKTEFHTFSFWSLFFFSFFFEKFKDTLLALIHSVRFFRSILIGLLRRFGDLLIFNRFFSAAKWWTLQCFMTRLRWFMYTRKSDVPHTDPWGTPLVMVDIFELKPSIETGCFRSVEFDSNHLLDILLTL